MVRDAAGRKPFERISTGVPGLDVLLPGGFKRGGTYLIVGPPGSGKTVLANQICFHQIDQGKKALYVTLLAESHMGMFENLDSLEYFDKNRIAESIQYMNGYSVLEKQGLEGLTTLLGEMVHKHGSSILFIDGVASAGRNSDSAEEFKKFVHNLNTVLGMAGCTTFLLSSVALAPDQSQPEHTMVDGILSLSLCGEAMKTVREIEVRKFRGSAHIYGRHFCEITSKGFSVYPRIESSHLENPGKAADVMSRHETGLAGLDELLDGGLVGGSLTSILGPPGTGKTFIGMSFLAAGARKGEPGLHFSFYEPPERLMVKLAKLNLPIDDLVKNEKLTLRWQPATERIFDKLVSELLSELEERNIKRLFLDGVGGLKTTILRPNRIPEVLVALAHELRSRGVTTIFTEEMPLFASEPRDKLSDMSAITDNIVETRLVELDGKRVPCISVVKTRESNLQPTIHELVFSEKGLAVGGPLAYVKPVLPEVKRDAHKLSGWLTALRNLFGSGPGRP